MYSAPASRKSLGARVAVSTVAEAHCVAAVARSATLSTAPLMESLADAIASDALSATRTFSPPLRSRSESAFDSLDFCMMISASRHKKFGYDAPYEAEKDCR